MKEGEHNESKHCSCICLLILYDKLNLCPLHDFILYTGYFINSCYPTQNYVTPTRYLI
ncbi:hypothetical protein BDB01DRAFT_772231 [Pilobolus umbonatus]|nr:hypothetical protein BDB01DRAFT_772231 [Pilobolus umbonatus]